MGRTNLSCFMPFTNHMINPVMCHLFPHIFLQVVQKKLIDSFKKPKMSSKQEKQRDLIVCKWMEDRNATYASVAKSLKLPKTTVNRVIKSFMERRTIERKTGSGKKSGPKDAKLAKTIIGHMKRNPNRSLQFWATKFGVSKSYVFKIKKNSGLKSFLIQKAPGRDEKDEKKARKRARKLYDSYLRKNKNCLIVDDETYVHADFRQIPGRSFYISYKRFGVKKVFRQKLLSKFPKKYLIWQAICTCGKRSVPFVTTGTINGDIYRQECLKKRLLPFLRAHKGKGNASPLFWPDLATCHYARDTLNWYNDKNIRLVPREANPPNCPELRPIERYWAIIKGHLRKNKKIAKNVRHFKILWKIGASKVLKPTVQRMMGKVKGKVRKFAYTGAI